MITPETSAPEIGPGDRLSFAIFLAVALHAVLIFGVTFTQARKQPATHSLEVTLARERSSHRPEAPDFLAPIDQVGSGTLENKTLLTTPVEAQFHDTEILETSQARRPVQKIREKQQPLITTTTEVDSQVTPKPETPSEKPVKAMAGKEKSLRERALEIASLQARLDQQRQTHARRPRIKRLTSLATASSADAFYLNSWRRNVEEIGNLNYPEEASREKLYGSLRLMVAILPDGSLKGVELLESSGHPVLDNAAIRIVELASPFAPFPDELRQTTDMLEIVRTWQFRKNSSLRSY